jgi:hypothetical protein
VQDARFRIANSLVIWITNYPTVAMKQGEISMQRGDGLTHTRNESNQLIEGQFYFNQPVDLL